jgi:hypothetical protein
MVGKGSISHGVLRVFYICAAGKARKKESSGLLFFGVFFGVQEAPFCYAGELK